MVKNIEGLCRLSVEDISNPMVASPDDVPPFICKRNLKWQSAFDFARLKAKASNQMPVFKAAEVERALALVHNKYASYVVDGGSDSKLLRLVHAEFRNQQEYVHISISTNLHGICYVPSLSKIQPDKFQLGP